MRLPESVRLYAGILSLCIAAALIVGGLLLVLIRHALGAEYAADGAGTVSIPGWFWPTILGGLVQGAVVFGAIKVKLDWLFQRITVVETVQREDTKALHARIDRALERRRATDTALD